MNSLKFDESLYTDSGFYDGDMDGKYEQVSEKLVKCRKSHNCMSCNKDIQKGNYAVCEVVLSPDEGYRRGYTCINCIEDWLVESGQVESENY